MLDAGVFQGRRFELIDGDLIDKTGQKPPHASAIQRFRETSMPEPDLAVVSEAKDDYEERHPTGPEMTLGVEVADTTIRPDLTRKRDLYATAGVREYWVLGLNDRRLVVHRSLRACHNLALRSASGKAVGSTIK